MDRLSTVISVIQHDRLLTASWFVCELSGYRMTGRQKFGYGKYVITSAN